MSMSLSSTGPRGRAKWIAEGKELERNRIREELHREVSQQLLGAALGCKVLATRVSAINEEMGRQALDLAELLNSAVQELRRVINPD